MANDEVDVSRVVVTGGRNYHNKANVYYWLNLYEPKMVLQGECPTGADKAARDWAKEMGVAPVGILANWPYYGSPAGPIRNGWLLDLNPTLVIAFPGNSGTADMVRQAKSRGVQVIDVDDQY